MNMPGLLSLSILQTLRHTKKILEVGKEAEEAEEAETATLILPGK